MIIKTYGQKALEIKPIIENHLNKIIDNIKSFTSLTILDNLTIEICDPNSPDCPTNIKKYAGLTWSHLKLIQLNTTIFQYHENPDKYYSNLLSHEFGHWWASFIGFDNNSEIKNIWQRVRGDNEVSKITSVELIAEDFRILFGADGSKDFERGDYLQATKVQSLKGLIKIFPSFTEYKSKLASQLRSIYSIQEFSNPDYDYFGLMIIDRHNFFFWDYQHYFIDNYAFYKYDYSANKWDVNKYL
jgi:hypothetical protein